jgi:hypothetical protein
MNDDINQQLLAELRKLRRSNQLASWFLIVFVVAGMVFIGLLHHEQQTYYQTRQSKSRPWDGVKAAMDQMDYAKALGLAQALVIRETNDCYGQAYLARISHR